MVGEIKMALDYMEYYTKDDFAKWEGDWELIYGAPYAMSPFALPNHQLISLKIARQLDEQLDDCPVCKAFMEAEVVFGEDTVVRPDSFVVCYPFVNRLDKAPDIIFEVVSKSSAKRDERLKFSLYESEGVKYYILVYPDNKKAKVYKLQDGRYIKVGDFSDETYTFEIECKIEFDFSFIWRG